MKYLMNQEEFEQLIGRGEPLPPDATLPYFTVVYFTANWCGACKRLDMATLESSTPEVNWLKCDVDVNNYTAGFCGIRSIPTFLAIIDKKIVGQLSSSSTEQVYDWIQEKLQPVRR